jgi:hypothetical protein
MTQFNPGWPRRQAFCGGQGDVVLILACTGLRFGELTGLNTEDVDPAMIWRNVRIPGFPSTAATSLARITV